MSFMGVSGSGRGRRAAAESFREAGEIVGESFRRLDSSESMILLKKENMTSVMEALGRMDSLSAGKTMKGLRDSPVPFLSGLVWDDLFRTPGKTSGGSIPCSPLSLLLAFWDENRNGYLQSMNDALLWRRFSSREAFFLYRITESRLSGEGRESWGKVPLLLSAKKKTYQNTPFDVLLAMGMSVQDGKLLVSGKSHINSLWKSVFERFAPDILSRVTGWVSRGGGIPAPFDIRTLFFIASETSGNNVRSILPVPQNILDKGALYRIIPEALVTPPDTANGDLFGFAVSLALPAAARSRELWFETDSEGDIEEIKNLTPAHTREFRRELLRSGLPWEFPLREANLRRIFLEIACPPGVPSPADMRHPSVAEYFIFMNDGINPFSPIVSPAGVDSPGFMDAGSVSEYFINQNMMPVLGESGFSFLDPKAGNGKNAFRMLSSVAARVKDDSWSDWDYSGTAVFLNLLLNGFIHPEMKVVPPSESPVRAALRGGVSVSGIADKTVRAFSLLEVPGKRGEEKGSGKEKRRKDVRYIFSLPWDRDIGVRVGEELRALSVEFPSSEWWMSCIRHLGENFADAEWRYAAGGLPAPDAPQAHSLTEAFSDINSRFVQTEAKKGLPAPGKKPGRRSRGEPEVPPQGMDIG